MSVVLTANLLEQGLQADDTETVFRVHQEGKGYTVKLMTLGSDTVAVITVTDVQIRPIRTNEIAHARKLAAI